MAGFQPPRKIQCKGSSFDLFFPDEIGTSIDFLSIFLDDDYLLETQSGKVSTVLDIGANLGFFSVAARDAFPNATIHSYEPNKELREYLEPHAKQADFEIHYEAVGMEDGWVNLDIRGETNQTRSQVNADGEIPQVAFRKTVERLHGKVDFAKIDCEGAEWEFLEDKEAWQNIRFLAMEYHLWVGEKSHQDADLALRALDFEILHQIPIEDYGLIYGART